MVDAWLSSTGCSTARAQIAAMIIVTAGIVLVIDDRDLGIKPAPIAKLPDIVPE